MYLPNRFKKIGWVLLIPSLILGLIMMSKGDQYFNLESPMFVFYSDHLIGTDVSFGMAKVNLAPTLVGIVFIIGCLLVGFSREKVEDEYIQKLRLTSLQWAVLVNYLLLIFAFLFIYGISFLNVMLYNMFTVLILFIARFNFLLYRNQKALNDEK